MNTTESVQMENVQLKARDDAKKNKSFPIDRALRLLTMKNSAWELDDKNYQFDGKEIVKASAAAPAKKNAPDETK